MGIKKVFFVLSYYFFSTILFGQQISSLIFSIDEKIRLTSSVELEIEELKDKGELITKDQLLPLQKYSSLQVINLLKTSEYQKLLNESDFEIVYFNDLFYEINDMKLYKALLFRHSLSGYSSAVCFYINIDEEYRRKHCCIGNTKYEIVFGENGSSYIMKKDLHEIEVYQLVDSEIELGVVYENAFKKIINYINYDTKQIYYYDLFKQHKSILKGLPPLNNPSLYCGYGSEGIEDIKEIDLLEVNSHFKIEKNVVYFEFKVEKTFDGEIRDHNTTYLLDYDFDGSRKKGVYKIKGDTWEFLPDL